MNGTSAWQEEDKRGRKCSPNVPPDSSFSLEMRTDENKRGTISNWKLKSQIIKKEKKIERKKPAQRVDWKALASFQTANVGIYTPSQQQVMGKLFFEDFLSQSSSLIFLLGRGDVLILIVLYSWQLW